MGSNVTAVWRPGGGAQFWAALESEAKFKALDKSHLENGLRLRVLQVDDGSFSAVWQPGAGAQHWQSGMSLSAIERLDHAKFQDGMRLAWIDTSQDVDDDDGWYGVWQPGSGAQFWRTGLSAAEFEAQDAKFFAEGLRLIYMRHDAGGSEKYLGLWRPGSGAQHWWSHEPVDLALLKQKNTQREAEGERLVALPPYGLNAIWRSGTGESPFLFAASFEDFKKTDASLFEQGFRLSSFGIGAWF
jgi:Bacterial tandem repeat domain 1